MRILILFFLITGKTLSFSTTYKGMHILSDDYINHINEQQSTWKAGRNFDQNTPISVIQNLAQETIQPDVMSKMYETVPKKTNAPNITYPDEYDTRREFPGCETIQEIRDLGACNTSWASTSVSAMSDRICIQGKSNQTVRLSVDDLVNCCTGCTSAYAPTAWKHWVEHGIVSGGDYNSKYGCISYQSEPCDHSGSGQGDLKSCNETQCVRSECSATCDKDSTLDYQSDLHFGSSYYVLSNNAGILQYDLMDKGPLLATMDFYSDLLHYQSGIYRHTAGDKLGSLSVKIVGWGVENHLSYWIVANSWNTNWGEKGFFRIVQFMNECDIESYAVGGNPKL